MFSSALIVFREVIEIAMIMGVVLSATRGLPRRLPWIWGGLAAGILGATLVGIFANRISQAVSGMGQEIFNACILFAAALVIGWTAIWVKTHARDMALHLKQVGHNVQNGKTPLYTLAVVIGLALLREGSEIVLFMYSMVLSGQPALSVASGSALGAGFGALVGVAIYFGLLKVPARYTLTVTSWLLMLLVAGLAAQATGFLLAAGYFSHYATVLWDSSWLLSDDSLIGKAMHSLVGYTARPSLAEIGVYILTLSGLFLMLRLQAYPKPVNKAAA